MAKKTVEVSPSTIDQALQSQVCSKEATLQLVKTIYNSPEWFSTVAHMEGAGFDAYHIAALGFTAGFGVGMVLAGVKQVRINVESGE